MGQSSCGGEPSAGPDAGTDGGIADQISSDTADSPLQCGGALSACGGQCVDTTSDGKNCGKCGHDCLGAGCIASVCLAKPIVLASGQPYPDGIAVDATAVYWTNNEVVGGHVMKCATGGCGGTPTAHSC